MKTLMEQFREILGVEYVGPHAPANIKEWEGVRLCGDCFCMRQSLHTHREQDAASISLLLQAVRERDAYVIGENEKMVKLPVIQIQEQNNYDKEQRNELRVEQRKRAGESL